MTNHCRVYFKHFDFGEQEYIPCELCGKPAVDIHHVTGRGKGKDTIDNLMAVCRRCHIKCQDKLHEDVVQVIHNEYLKNHQR
jgi:5-methylcytosine-specific restriction endonuclease McrA